MSNFLNRPLVAMSAKAVHVKVVTDLGMDELPTVWPFTNVDVDVFGSGELLVSERSGTPLLLMAGGTYRVEFLTPADDVFADTTQEARQ